MTVLVIDCGTSGALPDTTGAAGLPQGADLAKYTLTVKLAPQANVRNCDGVDSGSAIAA